MLLLKVHVVILSLGQRLPNANNWYKASFKHSFFFFFFFRRSFSHRHSLLEELDLGVGGQLGLAGGVIGHVGRVGTTHDLGASAGVQLIEQVVNDLIVVVMVLMLLARRIGDAREELVHFGKQNFLCS